MGWGGVNFDLGARGKETGWGEWRSMFWVGGDVSVTDRAHGMQCGGPARRDRRAADLKAGSVPVSTHSHSMLSSGCPCAAYCGADNDGELVLRRSMSFWLS